MFETGYLVIAIGTGLVAGLILSLFFKNALKRKMDSIETEKRKLLDEGVH
jgi:hypothetical protein